MSIFCVGGPEGIIVSNDELRTTEEDRYFLPGIIHGGESYIVQVWGWNNEGTPEGERIGVKYLFASDILTWAERATSSDGTFSSEIFEDFLNENAEEFVVMNDGTGDFVTLNEEWNQALSWDYKDVISWAQKTLDKSLSRQTGETKPPLDHQIQLASTQTPQRSTSPEKNLTPDR